MKSQFLVLAAVLALAAGCPSTRPEPPKGSGFLGDAYPLLLPHPNYAGSWIWQKPGADFSQYSRILIDPVEVRLLEKAEAQTVPAEMTAKCAEALGRILHDTVSPYYDVVKEAGPRTLRVRIALSDVMPNTSTPSGGLEVGGASGECEFLDAMTGERLVAVMSTVQHSQNIEEDDVPARWKGTEGAFHVWAKRLIDFLERQGVGAER
jgi:hypothetical protein